MNTRTKWIFAIFIVVSLLIVAYIAYFSTVPATLSNLVSLSTHPSITMQTYPRHDIPATGPTYQPATAPATAPATVPATAPATAPATVPATAPATAPTNQQPVAQSNTQTNQPIGGTSTHTTTAATQPTTQPAVINDGGLNSAGTPAAVVAPQRVLTYGNKVRLRNLHPVYGGYASVCGLAGICGSNVTLKPSVEVFKQTWIIEGKAPGTVINHGDIIKLYSPSTSLFLSPCNIPVETRCGVNVTLRPNTEFTKWEPNSNLRNWQVVVPGGGAVRAGSPINLKALATRWPGHSGWLSVCGTVPACGYNLSLRTDHAGYDAFAFELA